MNNAALAAWMLAGHLRSLELLGDPGSERYGSGQFRKLTRERLVDNAGGPEVSRRVDVGAENLSR